MGLTAKATDRIELEFRGNSVIFWGPDNAGCEVLFTELVPVLEALQGGMDVLNMRKVNEKLLLARLIAYVAQLQRAVEEVSAGHSTRHKDVERLGTRFDELLREWTEVCKAEGWADLMGGRGLRVKDEEEGVLP